MIEKNYKKVFVNVTADMRPDGVIRPLYFRWTDGNKYEIDKVRKIERAASLKVGKGSTSKLPIPTGLRSSRISNSSHSRASAVPALAYTGTPFFRSCP